MNKPDKLPRKHSKHDSANKSGRLTQALNLIEKHTINTSYIDTESFKNRFTGVTQGIAAEVSLPKARTGNALQTWLKQERPDNCLLLILDQIQDPHNLRCWYLVGWYNRSCAANAL